MTFVKEMKIAFVDESQVYLDGEKCLLYGVYICSDISHPAVALIEIRQKFNLPRDCEIKWTINTGDAGVNALVKEDLLCQTHSPGDQFLVSITRGKDKNAAFQRCIQQIHNHFTECGDEIFGIIFDRDVTPSKLLAEAYLLTLPASPSCQLFAEAASQLSAGVAVADGFAGAYAYMIHKQDIENQPEIEVHPELPVRLDDFFWEIFRRIIPGEFRWDKSHHEDPDIAMVETGYRHTLGHGLFVDPSLTETQINRLQPIIDLYQGCTV